MFNVPFTVIRCCSACGWSWFVCYVGGQKLLKRKKTSLLYGKIPVARNPAMIFAGVAAELRDMLTIPGKS
jgi:hypothetical protein